MSLCMFARVCVCVMRAHRLRQIMADPTLTGLAQVCLPEISQEVSNGEHSALLSYLPNRNTFHI